MSLATAKSFATAAYLFNEASGNALDSVGSNDLTDHNSVGTGTGLLGNARDFESSSAQFFDHADAAALSGPGDDDFTICLYINPESQADGNALVSKWPGGGNSEYLLRWVNSGGIRLQWFCSADGSAADNVIASTFGALSNGTWHSVVAVQDSVNNEIRLYVNGTKDSTSHAGGVFNGTGSFFVADDGGGARFDGLMDELVIIKGYAFTDADATEHWNSGAGKSFTTWDAAAGGGVSNIRRR